MATATYVETSPSPSLAIRGAGVGVSEVNHEDIAHLASLCRTSLNYLALHLPDLNVSHPYTADEILALPLSRMRCTTCPVANLHAMRRLSPSPPSWTLATRAA
jgi:NLR family CARD domain-containing protein 3